MEVGLRVPMSLVITSVQINYVQLTSDLCDLSHALLMYDCCFA